MCFVLSYPDTSILAAKTCFYRQNVFIFCSLFEYVLLLIVSYICVNHFTK